MEQKKKSCSITTKDDHDDHQDSSEKPELDLPVEKQNLVPERKKFVMKNHNGFVLYEEYYDDPKELSEKPELDLSVEKQNLVPERKNHNGLIIHKVYEEYYDEDQDSSEESQSSQDSSVEPESSHSVHRYKFLYIPKKKNQNLDPKKKKLLVMNLNGFLIHKVYVHNKEALPKSRTDHYKSLNFLLFKRPFSEEFMKFCLERFEVGIWSSAKKHNIDGALDIAIGEESKNKLLFVWDQSECLTSQKKSKENSEKPIFFKEIGRVWEKVEKGGPYSASNSLTISDKPYKFYGNHNTAIFIKSYDPDDKEDNALDPNGELCEYLKGVAEAEDVESYVKENAFGIPAITKENDLQECYFYINALWNLK